ncbi:hypothetical protein P3342_005355 [Pyrenophora teres f. teres]|nr:hypothetical protein P3342_005355 [Pyrenophora teres f. teres]
MPFGRLHTLKFQSNFNTMTKTSAYNVAFGLIVAVGSFTYGFESPHWLIAQKRAPEGWAILRKFHADPNDPNEFAAHKEFYQMKKQIEFELKNATGHLSIFRTPAYRKRVYMSCFIQYAANATGALVINNYSIIMYKYLPLLMYCVYTLIGALGNLFSLLTIDKTGRRL